MTLRKYVRATPTPVVAAELIRLLTVLAAPIAAVLAVRALGASDTFVAPVHRRLWHSPESRTDLFVYLLFAIAASATNAAWLTTALRNFIAITLFRLGGWSDHRPPLDEERPELPAYPFRRESFTLILGELQDRDGTRVPNERAPQLRPKWLMLPELALYTGFFVTGSIGTGKTSAVAYPALRQLLGFRRPVRLLRDDGTEAEEWWRFSGLVLDEKGDFTDQAAIYCKEWDREADLIRLTPGGDWIWNVIYNPNLPTWAVAYQLGWILKNFNKGQQGSDPFWENAPKELTTEYLGLLDDAEGYYTIADYLETLIDDSKQDVLMAKALTRFEDDPAKLAELERRWKAIKRRRDEMGVNLRGSLEACARAGIDMFRFPELRRTFCPTREEYFERDVGTGLLTPRKNVFTGFDQALDYGRVVGLEMPKQIWFDAAIFIQIALKSQWQDSVLRREGTGPDGKLLLPPRFPKPIGYCPTFLMADEAQLSATPRDGEFKAVCRSKRASMWELTQSHSSIKGAFGPNKQADAAVYFQNSVTHIYLRQSDLESMKAIQEECGKKIIQKTTLAVTEGGNSSELSYFQGEIVHEGVGVSSTKTVSTEEKPFLELEDLKRLPNNVAVVLPSNGDRQLPATITYLRPPWLLAKHKIPLEQSWFDWPEKLRTTSALGDVPTDLSWKGWEGLGQLTAKDVVPLESRLGRFIQPPMPALDPLKLKRNLDRICPPDGDEDAEADAAPVSPPSGETLAATAAAETDSEADHFDFATVEDD